MSELGSGSGTSYPSSLDVDNTVEVDASTTARADVPNDLAAAIIAVQTELGTDPAGSMTNVKTFLQTEHSADGTHANLTANNITISGELIQKVGSDVSSASDLDITPVGNFFDVTGTTGITTMKSKGVGTAVTLQFDGIVTITHHATNLDLGSQGANIVTVAGDVLTFYEYASADWRLVSRSNPWTAGMIVIWSGTVAAIPGGWVICDGNNSTPNLTAKFVIHASADSGDTYDVGDTNAISANVGATAISTSQMPAHTHTVAIDHAGNNAGSSTGGTGLVDASNITSASTGSGSTHTHTNPLPPYYALAYIMKT